MTFENDLKNFWRKVEGTSSDTEIENQRQEFLKRMRENERRKQEQAFLVKRSPTDPWL